jgi:predicted acyl esterase
MKERSMSVREKIRRHPIISTLIALIVLAAAIVLAAGILPPANPWTGAGIRRFTSRYIRMQDGTDIAVRVSLPRKLDRGQTLPSILETTRYGTWMRRRFAYNLVINLGIADRMPVRESMMLDSGYAFVAVDARGPGHRRGHRLDSRTALA